jgi:ABC-type branched-subunit amino acid transport system substrate-binding protein
VSRRFRVVALIIVLGMAVAACGARLDPQTRKQAADAVLSGGNGGVPGTAADGATSSGGTATTGGSTTTGGGSTTTGGGSTTTGGGSTTTGGGSTTTGGGSTTTGGGSTASHCPTSGTDVGLTSNEVRLGTIASTTGPVSGLFQGALQGMQAYRAYINSQGGICGHQVQVDFADDGTNCGQNQNDTENLAKKDFALVGSFSLYDGCGADYIKAHNIPDFHVQLDARAVAPSSHFDIEPGQLGYATGMFAFYAHLLGSKVKAVGTLYPNIPSAAAKQKAFVKSAEANGWKFVYSQAGDAQQTDWTNDFVTMCQSKHIQVFFTSAENAANAAKMIHNEDQAGCPKSLINIIPIAYDQAFIQDVGSSDRLEGMLGWNEYSLFFNQDEGQRIPEVQLFQQWFARANGNKPANLYAMFAWAEARLFQQAFENAGSTINRKTLIASAGKINNYSANGLVGPVNPSSKSEGVHCYILWKLHNNAFERLSDPATGYRCDGRFLAY